MDINSIFLIFLLIGICAVIYIIYRNSGGQNDQSLELMQKIEKQEERQTQMFERLAALHEQNRSLSDQSRAMREQMDLKLSQAHKSTQEQLGQSIKLSQSISGQAQKVISEVTEKLTKLDETNRQVVNFSAQLQNLQDILKNPKQRGVLGEYFLEETLKNVLPPNSYQMQYNLGKNEKGGKDLIVDAVIFVKEKMIPIDSKFSLENYEKIMDCSDPAEREKLEKLFKQDLKNRIDETAKYVLPELGTFEFAFMFIPSEAIYYDLLVNKVGAVKVNTRDLIEYAFREKKVVIVSPTSFLAYLQTVLQGLKAMQIEESAKQIKINVEKLGKHIVAYDDYLRKLGTNLATTVNHYNSAYKEFKKIDKDVVKIAGGESEIDPMLIDKPGVE